MSPWRSTHPTNVRPACVIARGSPNQDHAPSPIGGVAAPASPAPIAATAAAALASDRKIEERCSRAPGDVRIPRRLRTTVRVVRSGPAKSLALPARGGCVAVPQRVPHQRPEPPGGPVLLEVADEGALPRGLRGLGGCGFVLRRRRVVGQRRAPELVHPDLMPRRAARLDPAVGL